MSTANAVPVRELVNSRSMGRVQYGIVAIIFLVATLDGLDTQILSFVAPGIAHDWHIPVAALRSVFSVGLLGVMLGSLLLGPAGDFFGAKRVLSVVTLTVGVTTFLTGLSRTPQQMLLLRFLTGLGVGGSLPNTLAFISQFAPQRRRGAVLGVVGMGFSAGASIGGVIAAYILPRHSWQLAFLISGSIPLIFTPLVAFYLPETITQMLKRNAQAQTRHVVNRLFPGAVTEGKIIVWHAEARPVQPFRALFQGIPRYVTPLLWLTFFFSLLDIYLLTSWLPTLLQQSHSTARQAVIASTGYSVAGMLASPLLGWLIDRLHFDRLLPLTYGVAAGCTLWLASGTAFVTICMAAFATGFFLVGSQAGLNMIPSFLYPEEARGTGSGWGFGIGRVGSILGPYLVGTLLLRHWNFRQILEASAIPSLLCCVLLAMLLLADRPRREGVRAGDVERSVTAPLQMEE